MLNKGSSSETLKNWKTREELPTNWDWRNIDGKNMTTAVRNQHIPSQCGSCWAFAATSSISDRIKVMRKAAFPDVNIAVQPIISCKETQDGDTYNGCYGGDQPGVYEWIIKNSITEESCSNYKAKGWKKDEQCDKLQMCKDCKPSGNFADQKMCQVPDSYNVFTLEKWGAINKETAPEGDVELLMMNEIQQNGTIACGIDAGPIVSPPQKKGTIVTADGDSIDHDISVVGFGVSKEGVKQWVVRNSWGQYWGDSGYFLLERGQNKLKIETACQWTKPKEDWKVSGITTTFNKRYNKSTLQKNLLLWAKNTHHSNTPQPALRNDKPCRLGTQKEKWAHLADKVKQKHDVLSLSDLPDNLFWGDVKGVNQLSWTKQQHIPQQCGSCWAQGTTSAIADRTNIMEWRSGNTQANWTLSPQVVMNCNAGGSCHGGNPSEVLEFANEQGLVHDSCQTYLAKNPSNATCSGEWVCEDCHPPFGDLPAGLKKGCFAVTPKRVQLSDQGPVSGVEDMKKALQDGPISCGVQVTDKFEAQTSGIQDEPGTGMMGCNHEISLVGQGHDDDSGKDYWILRNSWGSHWGVNGFMHIEMGKNTNAIESDCGYGVPTFTKPNAN